MIDPGRLWPVSLVVDLVACNSRFGSGQFIETLLSVSFADDFSNKFTVTGH